MRPLSRIALAVCSASLLLLFFSTLSTLSAIASEQRDVSVGVEIWKGVVTKRLVSPQELKKQPVGGLREEGVNTESPRRIRGLARCSSKALRPRASEQDRILSR